MENLGGTSRAHLILKKRKSNILSIWANKNGDKSPILNLKLGWKHGTVVRNRFGQNLKFRQHLPCTFYFSKKKFKYFINFSKQNGEKSSILNFNFSKFVWMHASKIRKIFVRFEKKMLKRFMRHQPGRTHRRTDLIPLSMNSFSGG